MNFLSALKDGMDFVKDGGDLSGIANELSGKLENLHAEGKLDAILEKAEDSFKKEQAAADQSGDEHARMLAVKHFITALAEHKDSLPDEVKATLDKIAPHIGSLDGILSAVKGLGKK